ncbi:MAG: type II toxin-antitoxin system VapC family toxin [Micrococcales bacterium]|nr:type II toxin-antitoxin system VapC family toxin [Micrococcales bacterium]
MHVLDTNTISYFMRGDPHVVPRLCDLSPADVGVPAVVVYELRYGLARLPADAAEPRLAALQTLLAPMTILDFDAPCAEHAAGIRAHLESRGEPIGPHDVLIAATAVRHGAVLVTRNLREFSRIPDLRVVSWHDQP